MKASTLSLALLAGALGFSASVADAAEHYDEGPVSQAVGIAEEAGHMDEYVAYLASTWTKEQQALKDAGLILNYAVYSTQRRAPGEPDLYLVTTFANMAALDGFDDRSDPVVAKALGSTRVQDMEGMAKRNSYRTVTGFELIREMKIK